MSGEAEAIRSGGGGFSARGGREPDDQRERHLLAAIQLLAQQPQAALITLGPLLAVSIRPRKSGASFGGV